MKDFKIYVIIASVLLLVYLVAQYNRPQPVDWTQTLKNSDKIPFGTYVLYNRITDIFPGAKVRAYREPAYNVINDNGDQQSVYIVICSNANINEYDYNKLLAYVKKGNDVFIASSNFGAYISKKLGIETNSDFFADRENPIRFVNKNLDTTALYNIDKNVSNNYFSKFDTARAVVLGVNDDHKSNFIKYGIGKGAIYLNANPLMFTNYTLLQAKGAAYAAIALSCLKNTNNIFWDEYYTQGRVGEESLMRVFLRNTELKSALYIAFFSLLIFVLYEVKRRQRIIPIIEPLNNSTVEFANVVGQVYYEQRNNLNIAQKKTTYFLEYIRTRYYLKTSMLNDEFVSMLSQKSGVDSALVQVLIAQFITIRNNEQVSDKELISLNQNIEQFYIQSRP